MADLKIQQLDSIIPVVAAKTYLANNDLFLVKMGARGSAVADEDRKLRWGDLVTTLNLQQYMPNSGGTFTGDVTLNNTKAIQSNKASGASPVKLLYLDAQDHVMVGNATQQLRLVSPGYPIYVDPNGATSDFITTSNLPLPGSLAGGGSYTKSQSDAIVETLVAKAGSTMTGDLTFANAKGVVGSMENGTAATMLVLDEANMVSVGATNLQTNIKSVAVPKWNNGTASVDLITTSNLPLPGALGNGGTTGAYTKAETNAELAKKLNLAGGTLTGEVKLNNNIHLVSQSGASASTPNVEVDVFFSGTNALSIGDTKQKTLLRGSGVLQHGDGVSIYDVFTTGNLPTTAQLGLTDTVSKAATALQPGAYGLGGVPNHKKDDTFLTTTDETLFFVQDGSSTEQRFSGADGNGGGTTSSESGLGAGLHIYYGAVGTGNNTQYKSASLFIREDGKLVSKWSYLDYTGNSITTNSAVYYSNRNRPKPSDLGSGNAAGDSAYTRTESAARFAQKGINADITALNGLTGALKVGANANAPLEVTTLQQVQQMTSGTAGAVVGVVGGFVGAVMWFCGQRGKIPAGWAAADGQVLSRTGYPELWSAVNGGGLESTTNANWIADVTLRGKYSDGDGSTTFRLPDLNGKRSNGDTVDGSAFTGNDSIRATVLRGDGGLTIGTVQQNAAPEIAATLSAAGAPAWSRPTGSFELTGGGAQVPVGGSSEYQQTGLSFKASKSSDVYGRGSTTEVRMNSVVGIWIIRATSSFQAANTDFTVYNGMDSAPAANTPTEGGVLASTFSIGGVQNHTFRFSSQRNFGKDSYANLLIVQQASGGAAAKTANFKFGSDGKLTLGADATENLQAVTKQQMETRIESVNTDLQAKNVATNARMGYKILPTFNVEKNKGYTLTNPFGISTPVMVRAEVQLAGVWCDAGWFYNSNASSSYGVKANYVEGVGIGVRTGTQSLGSSNANSGTSFPNGGNIPDQTVSLPCRVHVWYIGA